MHMNKLVLISYEWRVCMREERNEDSSIGNAGFEDLRTLPR